MPWLISESAMDLVALRERLQQRLLEFAWDDWAQMGVLATPRRRSPWAQDPEALIVFTLEVARAEPRLFDEVLDWMYVNEALLSVRRLRAMCLDEADQALLAAATGWLARFRPRARLRAKAGRSESADLQPLFWQDGPVAALDPAFASAGLQRSMLQPSGKSVPPDLDLPINLAFRLRAILGVGVRSEAVRVMLTTSVPWMTTQALARASGYARRNVHDALSGLSAARVVSASTVGGEQRYTIDRTAWAALLGIPPADFPAHRDWPQLLGTSRQLLRWSRREELQDASGYLQASSARQLLDSIRPELAVAGIATEARPTAESAPGQVEAAVSALFGALDPSKDLPTSYASRDV